MSRLDGDYSPFNSYPGYSMMAPCMRSCEDYLPFNGCDNSGCWCKKNNLDRRISQLEGCASTSCTFADMNTLTDVDAMSGIQVQYCVDRGLSPAGMTMPSTVEAATTDGASSPGGAARSTEAASSGTESSRSRLSGGASSTGGLSAATSSPPPPTSSPSSSSMSTAAKAGIAVGAAFCVLLALIALLLVRRRKRNAQPPPPPYLPPPSSHTGPAPAPLHVQPHAHAGSRTDISPMEEKTPAFAVSRKEVGVVPAVRSGSLLAAEVPGSGPPDWYEVHGEGRVHGQGYPYELGSGR